MLRRKILYIILIEITAVLTILYSSYVMCLVFLIVVFIPVILWVVAWYVRNKIEIEVYTTAQIVKKNKDIQVDISIKNPTIFPIARLIIKTSYLHAYESSIRIEKLTTFVDAKNEQFLSVFFSSLYCGNISFTIDSILLYDYLSLFRFYKKINEEIHVSILPEFHVIEDKMVWENPNVLVESDQYSTTKSGDDSSEIFSIHEYREGDRINHIHWKLSLKEDVLMVKEFGLPLDCSVVILVELYKNNLRSLEEVDKTLQVVLSLSFSMITMQQKHYIAWYDEYDGLCKRMKIDKEEDLYETLSMLFQSKLYKVCDAAIRFHGAEFQNEVYTNIFYVTPMLMECSLQELEKTKRNAWCHIINVLQEDKLTEDVISQWVASTGFHFINSLEELHS